MDFKYIENETGREIAKKVLYGNKDQHPINAEALDILVRGATVLGIESFDCSDTKIFNLHLKTKNGSVVKVCVWGESNVYGSYTDLNISIADTSGQDEGEFYRKNIKGR